MFFLIFILYSTIFFINFVGIITFKVSKLSFFQNLINKLFKEENPQPKQGMLVYGDQLKHSDIDYKFAQLFTMSGGVFNYCADETEALSTLNKILKGENISSLFCCDQDLMKFLDVTKTHYTQCLDINNDAAFLTCEYLIAYDGRIMLSHNNILHFNSSRLPEKIIIMASVSQIVANLSEAMMKIKRRGNVRNLTSISGSNSQLFNPNKKNPKLFLLLLED